MGYPSLDKVYNVLPGINGKKQLISEQQTTNDIVNAVLSQHNTNVKQARKIAHLFDAGDIYTTCENIWNFLKYEIPYKVEKSNKQTAKTLSRIIHDAKFETGKNDCKHYSSTAASILDVLGIPFCYRFAGYSKYSNFPTHVYIVAMPGKENIIIDAVLHSFDTEKPYTTKIDKNMALYKLSGFDDEMPAVGGIFKKIKNVAKKVGKSVAKTATAIKQGALTMGLSIPRNAFLLLLRFNVHGWATGLSKMNFDQLKWWKDFGGNRTDLQKAIKEGASKKRILGIDDADILYDENSIGVEPTTTAAALASATPIIVKVSSVLAEAEKISNQVEKISSPVNKTLQAVNTAKQGFEKVTGKKVEDIIFRKEEGKTAQGNNISQNDLARPTDSEALKIANFANKTGLDTKKIMLIGGAGLLAAILLIKSKK